MNGASPPTNGQLASLQAELEAEVGLLRRLGGGISCTMDVLSVGDGMAVLRRHGEWGEELGLDLVARESAVLAALHDAHARAPRLIWRDERDVFAEPTLLIEYLEGEPVLDAGGAPDWSGQLAEALVEIHAVPLSPEVGELALYDFSRLAKPPPPFAGYGLAQALWAAIQGTLPASAETSLVHGDFWPGNTLWRDGRLIAVVDWEVAGRGDPIADVAYAATDMRYLGHDAAADDFIASYGRLSGRSLESLDHWRLVALARPLPDIARWLSGWTDHGVSVTADELRSRHQLLVEEAIAGR